jgi:ribosomal protein L37AE/L43A
MVEEHRCPYCLDPVSRNDPRGVKECDVCHTLHHADCWAITGVCQVPHLNT